MRHAPLCAALLLTWGCGADGAVSTALTEDAEADLPTDVAVPPTPTLRFATYNAALNRETAGGLATDLARGSAQARAVAEVVQRVRPDVLVLQEFDSDDGTALDTFLTDYLGVPQAGQDPIAYDHVYAVSSNTGVPTGLDLDRDGRTDGPGDAHGFGEFPGQYASVILSRMPMSSIRTWQQLRWADLPGATLPTDPASDAPWYTAEATDILRLSSKNHVLAAIDVGPDQRIFVATAHPTPPVFDGPEDRNGLRNRDEIKLLADLLSPDSSHQLPDDNGQVGGLNDTDHFVVLGDLNADAGGPGDALADAMAPLLGSGRISPDVLDDAAPISAGGVANSAGRSRPGDPRFDTAAWRMRVDYALPSKSLDVRGTGVYWPAPGEPGAEAAEEASDHRLVWVDVAIP